jgi:iron(III) transport system substrate-binding protein
LTRKNAVTRIRQEKKFKNCPSKREDATMKFKLAPASIMGVGVLCFTAVAVAASAPKTSEWEKTVAAAKGEGSVVIMGPAGADVRDAFTEGFQKKYPGIRLDYNGMAGAQVAPKLLNELSAGVYRTDLVIAGTITAIESLIPAKAIIPIQPYLVGPASQDLSKWKGGKFDFSDNAEKYNLVFGNRLQVAFVYNRDMVPSGKIRSWKDFLSPEWKGKITMLNPARAGASQGWVTFWYIKESQGFGKTFMRQLFTTQDVSLSNDERQVLDFVARGRYPIAIGPSGTQAFEMKNKGLPVELFGSAALQEGGVISASNGTVMVPRNAPHANAAKVYLDYLFSREGQHVWSKATGLTSRRRDVPNDHIPEVLVPKEGVTYLADYKEPFVVLRDEVVDFVNSVLSR